MLQIFDVADIWVPHELWVFVGHRHETWWRKWHGQVSCVWLVKELPTKMLTSQWHELLVYCLNNLHTCSLLGYTDSSFLVVFFLCQRWSYNKSFQNIYPIFELSLWLWKSLFVFFHKVLGKKQQSTVNIWTDTTCLGTKKKSAIITCDVSTVDSACVRWDELGQ